MEKFNQYRLFENYNNLKILIISEKKAYRPKISIDTEYFKLKEDNLALILSKQHNNISLFMKTSLKTLRDFQDNIFNTFDYNYHNGFIEGNNNFIKVIKRIAFGFRSFRKFKARIMICKGLGSLNKKANVC